MPHHKSTLIRELIHVVDCATPAHVRAWAALAPAEYDTEEGLAHLWCGDCTEEYMNEMHASRKCARLRGRLP